MKLEWQWHGWAALRPDVLYGFLKLRSDIFVVEQDCVFSDMDGLDDRCEHLCGFDAAGQLLAYLRVLPPGLKSRQPAIGRLVVHASARKGGVAREAMRRAIERCRERWPGQPVFLQGQQYLEGFYASLGFRTITPVYLEDGIPHVDMLLS